VFGKGFGQRAATSPLRGTTKGAEMPALQNQITLTVIFAKLTLGLSIGGKSMWPRILAVLIACFTPLLAGTYNAATCNQSDVNAVINGPIHSAVTGDTILIPAGTCTWSSSISIAGVCIVIQGTGTPNNGSGSTGTGTLSTTIIDAINDGNTPIFNVSSLPYSGCNGLSAFRISTLIISPGANVTNGFSPITIIGVCTSSGCPNVRLDNLEFPTWSESVTGTNADWMIRTDNVFGVLDHNTIPPGTNVTLLNANHSAYLGVGAYGDNSWAQPDSFGTANNLFMENNSIYIGGQTANDCDIADNVPDIGGCRIVGRYNSITANGSYSVFYVHGLDTTGRPRGGRQIEAYKNSVQCTSSGGCNAGMVTFRSGTGYVWGNTMTVSSGGFYNNIATIVVYRTVFTNNPFGACGGSGPWDTNDGKVYYSGTNSSSNGSTTLTDTTKSWSTNQLTPSGAPYSVYDVTQGWWAEIASNTSNTLTIQPSIPEQINTFNSGDSYQILRATACADQGGRGAGAYISGSNPSPTGPLSQALDPIYEWMDTAAVVFHGNISSDTGRTIANRDWYTDSSAGQQTSPTSPFNGASGVGWGTLANRPTTCTPTVGYWATDTTTLYKCLSTNTWTASYIPFTYPHPLDTSVPSQDNLPSPPTGLTAVVE
jgi:hypothetical protein